ncbi:MAG: glycerophosphodiester phosphodiesterase [Xanthomonadales bacterium]|jgi:glycerophosphoryl diester phosphodiesterase|nr:glycerophosphodiester phosphodiesterase [Xanthomonadales bacterium]
MIQWQTLDGRPTRIIAHRGASGLRPEHTRVGYELAIAQGADLIEPDLVPSRDGVLFARHDAGLRRSTDIARRVVFAARSERDRCGRHDWPVHHFRSEELATLRALQPFGQRSRVFDSRFPLPRFEDLLDIAAAASATGARVGVYPELKHPAFFAAAGIDVSAICIDLLRARGHGGKLDPVWLQCFETEPLRRVHEALALPVFLLRESADLADPAWLQNLQRTHPWLDGVALPKSALIGAGGDAGLVRAVHDRGWQVHVWTLRDDQVMPGFADVRAELRALFDLGVDALFADFPATAVAERALNA